MTPPAPAGGGVRAVAAPEGIGAVLAVVVIALLVLSGVLPAVGSAPASIDPGVPSATPSASATAGGVSTATRTALLAALGVNQRLAGLAEALEAAAEEDDPSGATVNAILRSMTQIVPSGLRAADLIADDPLTAALGTELHAFYEDLFQRAVESLGLSIQEGAAYRAVASELVTTMRALPAFDDRIADALEGRPAIASGVPASGAPSASASASAPASAAPSPSASVAPSGSAGASALPSPSPSGLNLIRNGAFESDLAGWALEVEPGAAARAAHDPAAGPNGSGAARIDIAVGSAARAGIAFVSSPFQLERGRRYRVTAMLRTTDVREVRLRVRTGDDRTTAARAFSIGATWSMVSFEVTELVAGSSSVLALDLGRDDAPVWLDDVLVAPLG
jgi:hypothetical protein